MDRPSLDAFAARHALDAAAVGVALDVGGLRPTPMEWRTFAAQLLHAAGLAGLGAGVLFFVAANWQRLGTTGRFALLQAALLAAVAVACWRTPPGRVGQGALLLATLLAGALLALFGQTYQTGADVHELFFAWALLALPFALAGHSAALWALWCGVLNVALALLCGWLGPDHAFWQFVLGWGAGRPTLLMLPWALNLLGAWLAVALSSTRRAGVAPPWLARALASAGFAYGTLALLILIADDRHFAASPLEHLAVPLAFAAVALAIGVATWRRRRDVYPMALIAASAIAVSTALLGRVLRLNDPGTLFLLATWLIGSSTGAGLLLMHWVPLAHRRGCSMTTSEAAAVLDALRARGLAAAGAVDGRDAAPLPTPARPWFIGLLLGASGWIAGLFVLGFVGVLFRPDAPASAALAGAVLVAAAWGLFRADREGAFVAQLALALSIAGQCLLVYAMSAPSHRLGAIAAGACALQLVLMLAMPNPLHRALSALFATLAWALAVRVAIGGDPGGFDGAAARAAPSLAAGVLGWLLAWLPVAGALGLALRTEPAWIARGRGPWLRPLLAGAIVGLAYATLASQPFDTLRWMAGDATRPSGLALWPLLSAFGALAAAAAAFALRSRALLGASLAAALLHLAHFYYALGTTLLVKSLLMAAMGAVLLGAARALERRSA